MEAYYAAGGPNQQPPTSINPSTVSPEAAAALANINYTGPQPTVSGSVFSNVFGSPIVMAINQLMKQVETLQTQQEEQTKAIVTTNVTVVAAQTQAQIDTANAAAYQTWLASMSNVNNSDGTFYDRN
jgi:hypothetical protein